MQCPPSFHISGPQSMKKRGLDRLPTSCAFGHRYSLSHNYAQLTGFDQPQAKPQAKPQLQLTTSPCWLSKVLSAAQHTSPTHVVKQSQVSQLPRQREMCNLCSILQEENNTSLSTSGAIATGGSGKGNNCSCPPWLGCQSVFR